MNESDRAVSEANTIQRRIAPRLHAFAVALTGSPRAAADLVQATMARLEAGNHARRGQLPLGLWAYRELHTLWLKDVSEQGACESGRRADPRCFAAPADTAEAAARTRGLAQAIGDLPPQQRATLLLVYGEGLSYDETAEVFGGDVKSVMTRIVRGHVAVGHWLDRREGSARRTDIESGSKAGAEGDDDTVGQTAGQPVGRVA